jgi:hypothetical protein
MDLSKISLRALGMLACLTVVLCSAHAQYRASIQGVVTDPQGSVVSDATVALKNLETGQTLTATTNESGIYNFNGLPPSQYSLTIEKAGFKKKVLDDVGVIAEQANAVNVQLEVGQISDTVTVNGNSTPLIDTETSSLSGTVIVRRSKNCHPLDAIPFSCCSSRPEPLAMVPNQPAAERQICLLPPSAAPAALTAFLRQRTAGKLWRAVRATVRTTTPSTAWA